MTERMMTTAPSGSMPVPDPTKLTTELVDKALETLRNDLRSQRTETEKLVTEKIDALRDVLVEKFVTVDVRFSERENQRDQTAQDTKTAVDAALAAAKESVTQQSMAAEKAINKAEITTAKLLEEQARWVDDLRGRMTRMEGMSLGQRSEKMERRETVQGAMTMTNMLIGLIGLIVGVAIAFLKI